MELIDLQKKVQDYVNSGFAHDVVQAARQAQEATRLFIKRTHPATGFDGQNLTNMIVKGAFKVEGTGKVVANVYANYFARWYNTGALGRIILRGPRKGQKGPTYAARGAYFDQNADAIRQYYMDYLIDYLERRIDL
ncbi:MULTISPECIES: hypothetical protein [Acidaminococcus]|uniref:hypothetical protein n=1 Tax=Acidaminococcus TaxID=904 RepID=UPI00034E16FC|nr:MULTISPECIES: hypothetical protein [Acidaminococcus]EPD71891.1 hypothetical protein HMPREF1479_01417 [Acidaminococcus sp. HPA0509]DAH12544.1 MAG TPA: hypothetical protein [Caudoviricetes sp.]